MYSLTYLRLRISRQNKLINLITSWIKTTSITFKTSKFWNIKLVDHVGHFKISKQLLHCVTYKLVDHVGHSRISKQLSRCATYKLVDHVRHFKISKQLLHCVNYKLVDHVGHSKISKHLSAVRLTNWSDIPKFLSSYRAVWLTNWKIMLYIPKFPSSYHAVRLTNW